MWDRCELHKYLLVLKPPWFRPLMRQISSGIEKHGLVETCTQNELIATYNISIQASVIVMGEYFFLFAIVTLAQGFHGTRCLKHGYLKVRELSWFRMAYATGINTLQSN